MRNLFHNLVNNESEEANATKMFYEEYFAVCDLPAEFYLETVRLVFQEYALAKGILTWRGRRIDPGAIRRTALLTIEGERDAICSLGQTLAAHDLCTGLGPYLKTHYVHADAGHYGVFSGKRWSVGIYPVVREAIPRSAASSPIATKNRFVTVRIAVHAPKWPVEALQARSNPGSIH